jgi:hypothetical protein
MEKRQSRIIILLALGFLIVWGCAAPSTISFKDGKPTHASNYTIKDPSGAAYVPNIPDNWFTSAMKQVFDSLGPFVDYFKGTVSPIASVAPTPTSAPVSVRPYP